MSLNVMNGYTDKVSGTLYVKAPKAVFAAIAVSFLVNMFETSDADMDAAILKEWQTLYDNGIVPQKPMSLEQLDALRTKHSEIRAKQHAEWGIKI